LRELLTGRAREALPLLRRATEVDPRWAPAWNDTGRAYVRLNDRVHAEECYRKAIETEPNWVYPYVNLAGIYFFQKDWATAEAWYLRAAQVDAAYATPWYFLGQVFEAQQRPADAVGAYEKAIELAKTRPSTAFSVDKVQERIQKVRAAIPPPSTFLVRLFNCDDRCIVYLDGSAMREVGYGQDSGWMPLVNLSRGPHRLTFEVWNEMGAITFGFSVLENGVLRFNNACGQAGSFGCFNNQARPRGLAQRFEYNFNY
jgi:tetratricopeptide (TPR) repeat protein